MRVYIRVYIERWLFRLPAAGACGPRLLWLITSGLPDEQFLHRFMDKPLWVSVMLPLIPFIDVVIRRSSGGWLEL
jgi:hypothetical protein